MTGILSPSERTVTLNWRDIYTPLCTESNCNGIGKLYIDSAREHMCLCEDCNEFFYWESGNTIVVDGDIIAIPIDYGKLQVIRAEDRERLIKRFCDVTPLTIDGETCIITAYNFTQTITKPRWKWIFKYERLGKFSALDDKAFREYG